MEKLIVDRITDGIAVLEKEDRSHIEVPLSDIVFEIKQGSVLLFDGEKYTPDTNEEDERRKRIFSLQEKLKNKNR
ncbi:MAG: DUF3006 domain-containing protein [Clostridia bacterium]|nr:DUF3006 domain-containing protein [Clostridia bacterium]